MNRKIIALLIALLALFLCAGARAQTECASYLDYGKAVAGLCDAQGKALTADALASRLLMRSKKPMDNLDSFAPAAIVAGPENHYTLQFSTADAALKCMETLKADKNVIYVQQDSLVTAYETEGESALAKADPYLSWGAKAMGADDLAANVTSSGSITVAVVDSGVAYHPFLNSRVKIGGTDFTDASRPDGRRDVDGHGTHVAGTIVDLTQGLNVNILPVRVLGDGGSGSVSGVYSGVRYAADAGAKVINMSLGGNLFSPYETDCEESDAINYAVSKGVTIVVAAGNESDDAAFHTPACFDNVIVVAAIDSAYKIASFSNYGNPVDVCAPGMGITSCSINGGYTDLNGTSMASPHVAAVAAMVKLQNPGFSPARVENYIKAHCLDLGKDGWDMVFGYGLPCFIENGEKTEGDYAYKVNSDGALITKYTGNDTNVVIPEKLGGFGVTAVEADAFKANAALESLTVPGGVKEIGNFSFADCSNLKSVSFGEGFMRIGDSAFSNCTALETVKLPETLKNLGGRAFEKCAALKSLELPKGIEAMGAYAMYKSGVTSFTVPAGLSGVPVMAFARCRNLESVVIEDGVKQIDYYAFNGCSSLNSITIPKSVTIVDYSAFGDCPIESIELPGVETLGENAFINCDKLVSMELPETLKTIDIAAFSGCKALEKLITPRSLETIGEKAFDGCEKLTIHGYTGSVCEEYAEKQDIPFTAIGYQVLLTKLSPISDEPLEAESGQFLFCDDVYSFEPENATLYELEWTSSDKSVCDIVQRVFYGKTYLALSALSKGACTVKGTAKDGSCLSISINVIVGDNAVRNVRLSKNALTVTVGETSQLTAAVLPETADQSVVWTSDDPAVAAVSDNGEITALSAGTAMITAQSVAFPEFLDTCAVAVEAAAPVKGEFTYRALDASTAAVTGYKGSEKAVAVPAEIDGLKIVLIDGKAFYKSDITSVTMAEGIQAIGEKAFAECTKLTSASLPNSLTVLAGDAFKGCKKLPKVKSVSLRLMKSDDGFILCPVFTPANTAGAYSVKLSNKKSATVTALGLVTPNTDDYFTVTVKSGGKKSVLGVSNGEPYAASKVTIDGKAKRTLKMGAALVLSYTVKPESARVIALWSSADPGVASVDQNGTVTPIAPGKTKITLETDLGLTDFITLTVK